MLVLFTLFILFPVSGFAQNVNLYEKNQLGVLHYRQARGESFASVNLSDLSHFHESATQNGNSVTTTGRLSDQSSATYDYGINDRFLIGVTETYLWGTSNEVTTESTGAVSASKTRGFSDPTLHANYLYWGELEGSHFGSASFDITPALGSHDNGDPGRPGNNVNASTSASLTALFYWVNGNQEWSVAPAVNFVSSGSSNDANPSNSSSADAHFIYKAAGNYRFHFNPAFFLQLGAGLTAPYSFCTVYPDRTTSTKESGVLSGSLTAGWLVVPTVLVSAGVTHQDYTYTVVRTAGTALPDTMYTVTQETITVAGAWAF